MASQISSLLKHGWENLWKNKILWIFSALVLIDPLLRLISPIPPDRGLLSSLLYLILSVASIYFMFVSYGGVSFVGYRIAIRDSVDYETTFQNATKLFWRVVGISFFLALVMTPCLFTVFIVTYEEPFEIVDLAHNFFLTSIPLSIFVAIWYFSITETITNNSKVGESIHTAWAVFTHNFISLAVIGFILAIASYVTNISISAVTMLAQNSFDFAVLSKLDLISPHLSVTNDNVYKLASMSAQTAWRTYSVSVFTFAYLKFSGAKMSKHFKS
jgi:hypothetical protein